jgi:tRNA nucleotidyltransferase (CCA-adding enzyme)
MIDDEGTEFKIKGCRILRFFLTKMDPGLLQRTGLGEVFEQALIPLLSYLPTLTPEPECLQLLGEVYPTLTILATERFSTQKERGKVLQSLDKILREGVLTGCSYAGDYPNIVTLLMKRLEILITQMGIQGVKHIKVGKCLYWVSRVINLTLSRPSFRCWLRISATHSSLLTLLCY